MSQAGQPEPKRRQHKPCAIREIDPGSMDEIDWVARGMRRTLIEVEGEEVGTALYTIDWLIQRVRWHLDPDQCIGKVFVAEDRPGHIIGHTIVRIEFEDDGRKYGLFSTTYVDPASRKRAVASDLLLHGENWMHSHDLHAAATWTSATNKKLISLYEKHGYEITAHYTHDVTGTPMVKLGKMFGQASPRDDGGSGLRP